MTVMTIITVMPAVSQTPPVLSLREAGLMVVEHPESPDTTPTAGWKNCRHSTQLELNTGVVCTLQTHTE